MQNAWSKGYRRIIFEGDCQPLANLVSEKTISFGMYNYVREVWTWSKKFAEVKFQRITRESNKPADILASQDMHPEISFEYYTNVPTVIRDALHHDYTVSSI